MKQLQPDLWQSSRYSSGMLNTHAYLLARPEGGNILFYNTASEDDLKAVAELGGIDYQLLTHRDEAGPSLARIKETFGSELCCTALEAPAVSEHAEVDRVFGPGDHRLGDVEILETPGHTDGSACFFYESPHGKAYLFSGDTFFPWNGTLSTFVIQQFGGSEAAMARSLGRLRTLKPDIVMSSGFVGEVAVSEIAGDAWTQAIDAAVARLGGSR